MQCLTQTVDGFIVASPQPTELSTCTFLLVQPSELPNQLMNLTLEESLTVGSLLGGLLVVGFIFRAVAQALSINDKESEF